MKKKGRKVLAFPAPREEAGPSPVIVQVGRERFAIHFEIEDLPPAVPPIPLKRASHKETPG